MAETTNKPSLVGKIFKALGIALGLTSVFAAGVAAADTQLGHKVNGLMKKGARKIGLGKAEDKDGSSSSSDQERDKDRL